VVRLLAPNVHRISALINVEVLRITDVSGEVNGAKQQYGRNDDLIFES
jgi:hypothetical protein